MQVVTVGPDDLKDGGIGILSLIVLAGLASSNSEARRLVQQGAVRLGAEKIADPRTSLAPPMDEVLRCGKRGFARVVLR
jgi:tyrosyl-tRNA synthetase